MARFEDETYIERYVEEHGQLPVDVVVDCDAVRFLRQMPYESVDLIITDPAYESLEKHRSKGTTTRLKQSKSSSNPWFPIFRDPRYPQLLEQMYRVMKRRRHAYLFCDETTADVLKPVARAAGFWVWKEVIWVKTTKTTNGIYDALRMALAEHGPQETLSDRHWWEGGYRTVMRSIRGALNDIGPARLVDRCVRAGMGYHWRGACERILFLEKRSTHQSWPRLHPTGKGRQLNDKGEKDVLFGPPVLGPDAYPTEKPISVVEKLLLNSSNDGEIVVDMFAGSGVVGESAHSFDRHYLLSDIHPKAFEHMKERLP